MKNLLIVVTIIFSSVMLQAQPDIVIADSIVGKRHSELEKILTEMNIEYYITKSDKCTKDESGETILYIVKDNSVRLWRITHRNIYSGNSIVRGSVIGYDIISNVFVRYHHDNMNDLRDFFSYEKPESTKYLKYEKELGQNVSHLEIEVLKFN